MVPDFSPTMLKAFLHVRVGHAVRTAMRGGFDIERAERTALRQAAGVTKGEFWDAWQGKLETVAPRLKLWAALGIVPGDLGVMLTDDGGQEPRAYTKREAADHGETAT